MKKKTLNYSSLVFANDNHCCASKRKRLPSTEANLVFKHLRWNRYFDLLLFMLVYVFLEKSIPESKLPFRLNCVKPIVKTRIAIRI